MTPLRLQPAVSEDALIERLLPGATRRGRWISIRNFVLSFLWITGLSSLLLFVSPGDGETVWLRVSILVAVMAPVVIWVGLEIGRVWQCWNRTVLRGEGALVRYATAGGLVVIGDRGIFRVGPALSDTRHLRVAGDRRIRLVLRKERRRFWLDVGWDSVWGRGRRYSIAVPERHLVEVAHAIDTYRVAFKRVQVRMSPTMRSRVGLPAVAHVEDQWRTTKRVLDLAGLIGQIFGDLDD